MLLWLRFNNAFFQRRGLPFQKGFQIGCRSLHLFKTGALMGDVLALESSQMGRTNRLVLRSLAFGPSNFSFFGGGRNGKLVGSFPGGLDQSHPIQNLGGLPPSGPHWPSCSRCPDGPLPLVLQVSAAAPLECLLSQRFALPLRRMTWR